MADRYYRPGYYSNNRRPSVPNPTWRKERSPPPRPQPARSYSNMEIGRGDPQVRDPRLNERPPDPRLGPKRQASRSPEGGQARKQPRADGPRETANAINNTTGSRGSSTSNGTPRHQGLNIASPQDRRPSADQRDRIARGVVNSPDSRNGARDGISSGRSTPQQTLPKTNTAPAVASETASTTDQDSNAVYLALMDFASVNADLSQLHVKQAEAGARLERAQKEFSSNSTHFKGFPAIEERKTAARTAAQGEIERLKEEAQKNKISQHEHMQNLAKILQDAAKPQQPIISKDDFVSREVYQDLKKDFEDLKTSVGGLQADVVDGKQFKAGATAKLATLASLEGEVDELKTDNVTLFRWKHQAEPTLDKVDKLIDNVNINKTNCATLFAWKTEAEEKIKRIRTVDERINQAVKQSDALRVDVGNLQKAHTEGYASKESQNRLEKEHDTLIQNLAGLRKDLNKLSKESRSDDTGRNGTQASRPRDTQLEEQLITKVEDFTEESSRRLEGMQSTIDLLKTNISAVKDHVYENKEDTLMKRVVQVENELKSLSITGESRAGENASLQRLGEVETRLRAVQDRMAGSTTITPPTPTYDTAAGAAPLSERVSKLEEELRSFEGTSGDIAEEIEENLKKGLDAIGSRVTNLETGRDSDANRIASLESGNVTHLESFNSTMERMKYHIERLRTDLQEKASVQALTVMRNAQVTLTKDFDDLGAELKRLKDQLQQLLTQYQQDKANATPRAPTPNQHQHHPQQQQPQMPRSSPHIQNGHMPSPMVNGVSQSPSHGHGPTAQGQAQMTKPLPIQPQIDTLFMVVDQLKRRSDNLTTDELAKVMLNQFEAVWPHAKNYEASLSQVREGCTQLENMVRALKNEKNEDVAKVLGEAESMKGLINDMQGKVEALGRTTKALQKDIGKSSSGSGGARGAVQEAWIDEVRSELRKVETIAKDAHNMATKHGQLLHAIDIREMNGRVDDFGNAIFDLQTKASEMEVFKPEFRAVQAALSALKGEFSTTWGKVHNLEVAAARRQGAAPPS